MLIILLLENVKPCNRYGLQGYGIFIRSGKKYVLFNFLPIYGLTYTKNSCT